MGREGGAFGKEVLLQGNLGRLGLYGFAGSSSISGYAAGGGIKANLSDHTLGFGAQYRIVSFGKRFTVSAFCQAAYYGSHVHATYFDADNRVNEDYRSSDRDPLVTIGPEIDYRIVNGLRIAVRPGKNFGQNIAAQTVGGVSIDVGVLVDTQKAGIEIAKGLKELVKDLP